ncbi:hypothetical protein DRO60_02950 [Candidatus Bathyarchaeota archaeon]|nr:MAG: hypothetical protein DRO60_02950 [Candidatus Bathyarchaeota archaeon]
MPRRVEGLHGLFLGVMDGVIHALSTVSGLQAIGDRTLVLIGLAVVGLADALANAVGFHVQEETEELHSRGEIWKGTFLCFTATNVAFLIMALPTLLLPPRLALAVSWILGLALLALLGLGASSGKRPPERVRVILEYVLMGAVAAALCYQVGRLARCLT